MREINTEWGIKQVMRSPIALALFGVLLSVIAVLLWAVRLQNKQNQEQQIQIIICKEQAAITIRQDKDDYIAMLLQVRAEQDSSARKLKALQTEIANLKRRK